MTDSAVERLKKGDRVRINDEAKRNGVRRGRWNLVGTVSSSRWRLYVPVIWDGNKTPSTYHPSYIEKAEQTLDSDEQKDRWLRQGMEP